MPFLTRVLYQLEEGNAPGRMSFTEDMGACFVEPGFHLYLTAILAWEDVQVKGAAVLLADMLFGRAPTIPTPLDAFVGASDFTDKT